MKTVTIEITYDEENLFIEDLPPTIVDLDPAIKKVVITKVTETGVNIIAAAGHKP